MTFRNIISSRSTRLTSTANSSISCTTSHTNTFICPHRQSDTPYKTLSSPYPSLLKWRLDLYKCSKKKTGRLVITATRNFCTRNIDCFHVRTNHRTVNVCKTSSPYATLCKWRVTASVTCWHICPEAEMSHKGKARMLPLGVQIADYIEVTWLKLDYSNAVFSLVMWQDQMSHTQPNQTGIKLHLLPFMVGKQHTNVTSKLHLGPL